ncbi:hypothetical protein BDF19DRAFT_105787 [Syncephalis fuscata]|nr:hypothetical protein BDF19DRAFT_105787 [Syncephalis fuscata]
MSQKLGALQRIQDITRIGGARIERHPLVNARVYIQTAASHLPKIPASAAVDAATGPDIQGCWQARPGNTKLPWQLAIPTNLPSIFKSRLAKVKYRVVAAIDVLYRHRKQTVIAICDLPLCEMLDHQYQLSQLLSTACTQESSCVLKRGVLKRRHPKMFCSKKSASSVDTTQIVERQKIDCEIKLRVRINRSVWVAGNTGYVEVCLKADNIKRVSK